MPLSEKRIKTDFKARLGRTGLLLRGTLRLSSLLTPERAVARTTHLGVSPHLPSDKEITCCGTTVRHSIPVTFFLRFPRILTQRESKKDNLFVRDLQ